MALVSGLLPRALAVALGLLPGQVFAARGSWTDQGVGCCNVVTDRLGGGVLSTGRLVGGECLDVCFAECARFGELCGYVNHGWVEPDGTPSPWCTVVSASVDVQHESGEAACGPYHGGESGVRCYRYQPAMNEHFFASSWTDLGAGCAEPHDPGRDYLIKGSLGDGLEACIARCMSFGPQCGFINHGRANDNSWCSIVSSREETIKFTVPPNCGICGDCGVHVYRYQLPTPAGPWVDLGSGCCEPADSCHFLRQGSIATSLESCQQQCALYGELCRWVNYGWSGEGVDATWCSVISTEATNVTRRSGPRDCGSCGDCGVHCWEVGRPAQISRRGRL